MEASQTVLPFKLSTTDESLTARCGLDLSRTDASRPGGAQGGSVDHEKNLSDKLNASGGVIKPSPGVDPEIVKAAPVPESNSAPVIPPPGVLGGPPGRAPKKW